MSQFLKDHTKRRGSLPLCVVYGSPGKPKRAAQSMSVRSVDMDAIIEDTIDKVDDDLQKADIKMTFTCINEFRSTQISMQILQMVKADQSVIDKQVRGE